MDKIVCELCKREDEPSIEFPSWCKSCSDKYGDFDDDSPRYQPVKRKKRKEE